MSVPANFRGWARASSRWLVWLRRFDEELNSRAAIVGPHGSGKSTLMAHLLPKLGIVRYREILGQPVELPPAMAANETGREILWFSIRRDCTPSRQLWASRPLWQPGGLLAIDGFEQLPLLSRWLILASTRLRGIGLLVTAHRNPGLKPLLHTGCSPQLAQEIVMRVLEHPSGDPSNSSQESCAALTSNLTSATLLSQLLDEEKGNMREVLMRLYDMFAESLPNARLEGTVSNSAGEPSPSTAVAPQAPSKPGCDG